MADNPNINDPLDPNEKKVLDNMREHGDVLRKTAEGHTATEIGNNLDLGVKAEATEAEAEHDDTISSMSGAVSPEAEHSETIASMETAIPPAMPQPADKTPEREAIKRAVEQYKTLLEFSEPPKDEERNAIKRAVEADKRKRQAPPEVQALQSEHNETVLQMQKRAETESKIEDEQEVPLTATFQDTEQTTFPGKEQTGALSNSIQGFLREDAAWRAELTKLVSVLAERLQQHTYELRELRAYMERNR